MALIFGTETGFVEVEMFNELKADAGPAHGLKGLGDYRSLYVNNNEHANHHPKDPEHRTVDPHMNSGVHVRCKMELHSTEE